MNWVWDLGLPFWSQQQLYYIFPLVSSTLDTSHTFCKVLFCSYFQNPESSPAVSAKKSKESLSNNTPFHNMPVTGWNKQSNSLVEYAARQSLRRTHETFSHFTKWVTEGVISQNDWKFQSFQEITGFMMLLTCHVLEGRFSLEAGSRSCSSNPLLWLWGTAPWNTAFHSNLLFKDCSDCRGRKEMWETLFNPDAYILPWKPLSKEGFRVFSYIVEQ